MQKNFRLIAAIVVIAIANFQTFAQTETHKDVELDGKPAKLNLKTGEVIEVNNKSVSTRKVTQDSIKLKTEIQANLITNTSQPKKANTEKVIATSRPDTLVDYYKDLLRKDAEVDLETATNESDSTSVSVVNDVIIITPEKVESEMTSTHEESSSTYAANNGNYAKSTTDFHLVRKGETLYSLSRLYNTTLGELKRANNLETTLIQVGQKLHIRNFEQSYASFVWVVSKGDTLYSIAKKNQTTVASLKTLNGLTSDLILPGQKLRL